MMHTFIIMVKSILCFKEAYMVKTEFVLDELSLVMVLQFWWWIIFEVCCMASVADMNKKCLERFLCETSPDISL